MCGIGLVLLTRDGSAPVSAKAPSGSVPASSLRRRGPDAVGEMTLHSASTDGFEVRMTGAVLHLRGDRVVPQPIRDARGNCLLWNGEIFGAGSSGAGVAVASDESDTERLLLALGSGDDDVPAVMNGVQGPWAFAYWDEAARTLWYGRDPLGRRSLLRLHLQLEGGWRALVLSSIALPPHELRELVAASTAPGSAVDSTGLPDDSARGRLVWEELPADGVGCVCIDAAGEATSVWRPRIGDSATFTPAFCSQPALYDSVAALIQAADVCEGQAAAVGLLRVLSDAVHRRVQGVPPRSLSGAAGAGSAPPLGHARVGVLFSGGIDSMVLARLADLHLPQGEPIDLINVAFGDRAGHAPDRLSGILGARELCAVSNRPFRLVCVDVSLDELQRHRAHLTALLGPANT
eukprot:368486-Prymnesium_polylepis.1